MRPGEEECMKFDPRQPWILLKEYAAVCVGPFGVRAAKEEGIPAEWESLGMGEDTIVLMRDMGEEEARFCACRHVRKVYARSMSGEAERILQEEGIPCARR